MLVFGRNFRKCPSTTCSGEFVIRLTAQAGGLRTIDFGSHFGYRSLLCSFWNGDKQELHRTTAKNTFRQ
jgi:hypothetical protein